MANMKRNWGSSTSEEGGAWSHPYATSYSSLNMPFNPSPLHNSSEVMGYDSLSSYALAGHVEKKPRVSDAGDVGRAGSSNDKDSDGDDDDDEDDDDEDGDDGKGGSAKKGKGGKGSGKGKVKLTRGSRACIACRKIKMRCIPDESNGPNGPCKRCKSGGHECIFEESNRGKRSTRKNEAMAAKLARMESALRGIGATLSNLDQPSLNTFSTTLHKHIADADVIQLITSHAAPSVVPTLAVAMNRNYPMGEYNYGGEESSHNLSHSGPPLSPRLHSLPDNALSPLGLLAEASLQNTEKKNIGNYGVRLLRPSPLGMDRIALSLRNGAGSPSLKTATSDVRGGHTGGDDDMKGEIRGVASQNYFLPGASLSHLPDHDSKLPGLMSIVTKEEIVELFDIYFTHISAGVPTLYSGFHHPDLVLQRSQFLCTVICAIAARFYKKREDLHGKLSAYVKRLAFEVPSRGYKSVEIVQAYLLLSVWTLGPEKTFEQDRTWMMLGMAIRMATDLNLHRKSIPSGLDTEEGRARDLEIINRERCWLLCFVLDRSLSAQMGKPYTLREDYIIRNACEASWHQQRLSLPSDNFLAGYVVLQQIMSRAIDSIYSSTTTISGLRQDCDYMLIVRSAHEELRRWYNELWTKPDHPPEEPVAGAYDARAEFYFAYSSLVLYSFGLENALERAKMDISFFLTNVYEAATRVCTVVKEKFAPRGILPYVPDTNFVMCSYALLSLLKLLKPELRPYHESEEAIFKLVSEVADLLADCAADPSHQPAIYAAFIREIVRKTKESRRKATAPPSRVNSPARENATGLNGTLAEAVYDPQLLAEENWGSEGDLLGDPGAQFTFIPSGGDMMILPQHAGPSESVQNSPSSAFFPQFTNSTPQASGPTASAPGSSSANNNNKDHSGSGNNGWAEYLPTFMSADSFDGWDGSMLLPGFDRAQITLSGGLLHSQHGSGLITPAQHTPVQSRAGSRAASRAQTPT